MPSKASEVSSGVSPIAVSRLAGLVLTGVSIYIFAVVNEIVVDHSLHLSSES